MILSIPCILIKPSKITHLARLSSIQMDFVLITPMPLRNPSCRTTASIPATICFIKSSLKETRLKKRPVQVNQILRNCLMLKKRLLADFVMTSSMELKKEHYFQKISMIFLNKNQLSPIVLSILLSIMTTLKLNLILLT